MREPEGAYSANITHNLGKMAEEAGIYKHLWRPEEIGITKAWSGLNIRAWTCSACGKYHLRDENSSKNALRLGQGMPSIPGPYGTVEKDGTLWGSKTHLDGELFTLYRDVLAN